MTEMRVALVLRHIVHVYVFVRLESLARVVVVVIRRVMVRDVCVSSDTVDRLQEGMMSATV